MSILDKVMAGIIVVMLFGAIVGITILQSNQERNMYLDGAKYTLTNYTGVGSGVFKHGTIVKVVNGQPVVVRHFDDDSGKEYPGTVEIKEVQ